MKFRIPTYFDSLITNKTMKMGANDIFEVKTDKTSLFTLKQAKTNQNQNLPTNSKLVNKPKTSEHTRINPRNPKLGNIH